MLAAAQRFFQQFDAFDGALTLGSQFGAAESLAQFFQPLVVTAGNGAQTVCLSASSSGFTSCFMGWFQSQDVWYISLFKPTIV